MTELGMMLAAAIAIMVAAGGGAVYAKMAMQSFPVLAGAGAHDVYPAPDGTVWFTAQSAGKHDDWVGTTAILSDRSRLTPSSLSSR